VQSGEAVTHRGRLPLFAHDLGKQGGFDGVDPVTVVSDMALGHAHRAPYGRTAVPGTAGPAGTVALIEGRAPHGQETRRPQGRPSRRCPGLASW
jgi:hypothetical protein